MPHFVSFSSYQTKCVIKLLFSQLMIPLTLRFIFIHPIKQWLTEKKEGKMQIQKSESLKNEMSSFR